MLKKLLSIVALLPLAATAQTVATFESLPLSKQDTFYVNYTMPGKDVGFINGLAHFPTFYDTSSHIAYWNYGFAYSNMRDTVTSGYLNQYSAKTGSGYGGSANYAVAYGVFNRIQLLGAAAGHSVKGFYITNSTYAYNDMRDGSTFSKKFGGATGNDPDFFKLMVKGYKSGALTKDSVEFFLADYRFNNHASDYILKDWSWVDLMPLGPVDSLEFTLSTSDTSIGGYPNTPAYFCMDNFTTNESGLGVNTASAYSAKVYPMPARDILHVEDASGGLQEAIVVDGSGRTLCDSKASGHLEIPLQGFASGVYFLQLRASEGRTATVRFVKE